MAGLVPGIITAAQVQWPKSLSGCPCKQLCLFESPHALQWPRDTRLCHETTPSTCQLQRGDIVANEQTPAIYQSIYQLQASIPTIYYVNRAIMCDALHDM